MNPNKKTARQLYRDIKAGGASEEIMSALAECRSGHPLDLAAKVAIGLFGIVPTAKPGQLGLILILRSILLDALTMYGEGTAAPVEEDLTTARMLLRDAEAIEQHLNLTPD